MMCGVLGCGSLIVGLGVWALNAYLGAAARPFIYASPAVAPDAYTALILGAKILPGGFLSHMLEDRVLTGLDLYRQGKVKKLLLSGDHGRKDYDEVNAMRAYLLKLGVPAADIFLDHAGFNTYNSMYRARDIFQVRDVIVVTQRFHVARAVYLGRALGLNAVGVVADRRTYTPKSRLKSATRETLARVKAVIDVHILRRRPTYLGDVIPITGDGRKTLG